MGRVKKEKLENSHQANLRDISVRTKYAVYTNCHFGFYAKMQGSTVKHVLHKYLLKFLTYNGTLFVFPRQWHGVVTVFSREDIV